MKKFFSIILSFVIMSGIFVSCGKKPAQGIESDSGTDFGAESETKSDTKYEAKPDTKYETKSEAESEALPVVTEEVTEKGEFMLDFDKFPKSVDGGKRTNGHVQGIAVDAKKGFIYYSFTTILVKSDLKGNVIGTVEGLIGHLGCLDFNDETGKVYGSLELKHDSIGQGIMEKTGIDIADEDAFYVAVFDVDKIDREGMHAEDDGIMTAAYLKDVVDDYTGTDTNGKPHRYGCSGIDGVATGPMPGAPKGSPSMLFVAYGIYGDCGRDDNDNQVILCLDPREVEKAAMPLEQGKPHHFGVSPERRLFLYTGNTVWGIQGIEYDAFSGNYYVAVYKGKKPSYPNYPMFVIDGSAAPRREKLAGREEYGDVLRLAETGVRDAKSGVGGLMFERGQTGMYSFGNGYFYFSHEGIEKSKPVLHTCTVKMYKLTVEDGKVTFSEVE